MAKDLHELGAMDDITMRVMDRICVPEKRPVTKLRVPEVSGPDVDIVSCEFGALVATPLRGPPWDPPR